MLWLIGLVLLQQIGFHWFLEPFVDLATLLLELSSFIWVLFLGLGGWLLSDRVDSEE
ncbi:hypothetical protein OMCYN_00332 [cyanobiont of Ornithocercus magnificus]|nr:hypothetical protein OMCYN_00332 [cyanobiont of Ornithocercus magnificus]